MEIRCTNKKCLHEWNYKGNLSDDKDYVTCPICRYKSMLKKAINGKKDTPIYHKSTDLLTDSLTYPKKNNRQTSYKRIIEKPQTEFIEEGIKNEEEFEEQKELFPEKIIKLCNTHNLPAQYNDYEKKWLCNECIESKIEKNISTKKVKELISHLGGIKLVENNIEIEHVPYQYPINKDPILPISIST